MCMPPVLLDLSGLSRGWLLPKEWGAKDDTMASRTGALAARAYPTVPR